MASYINRVYEIELEDKTRIIVKFYRPGRWSREALKDEQDFLFELEQAEIPVIAPLSLAGGETLGEDEGIFFAVFPKKGGRKLEEPRNDEEWLLLGRLIARIHLVGAKHGVRDRIRFTPKDTTQKNLETLKQSGFLPPDLGKQFEEIVRDIIEPADPLFEPSGIIRIHGDCHRGNLLVDGASEGKVSGAGFRVIDFDDMAVGPPMQDLWMLLPGRLPESRHEMNLLAEGYETFRPVDRESLKMIEPLRAMRFLHYAAWCSRQAGDAGFRKHFPEWGTRGYWVKEIADLHEQREIIIQSLNG